MERTNWRFGTEIDINSEIALKNIASGRIAFEKSVATLIATETIFNFIKDQLQRKNMNQVKYCDLIDCENNEDARSGHRMVVINDILYVIGNYDIFYEINLISTI